jgi:GT2 family glycosyltransferase
MVDLSIVIVNWNTRELLRACLSSIFRYPPLAPFEVIVIDNASSDGSAEMVRGEFSGVRLEINPANLGFAAANNLGSRLAAGRFLLFLNSDLEVHPLTLNGALRFMENNPGTGAMGCRTLNSDGSLQCSAKLFPGCLRIFAHVSGLSRLVRLPCWRGHSRRGHPDYVQGAFLVIKKSTFERSGGFNEKFFLFGEDVDLCLRLRRAGLRIEYDPALSVTHHGGASSRDSLQRLTLFITSCRYLYHLYRSPAQARRLRACIQAALAVRLCREIVLVPSDFQRRKKRIRGILSLMDAAAAGGPPPGPK